MSELRKIIGISSLLMIFLISTSAAFPGSSASGSITYSKINSGSKLTPLVNEYVRYDLTIENTSDDPLENKSLSVNFTSVGGGTNVSTTYFIGGLLPGESKPLHLGPFKVRDASQHSLFVQIKSESGRALTEDSSFDNHSRVLLDTFTVYEPITIQLVIAGIVCISIGLGFAFGVVPLKSIRTK